MVSDNKSEIIRLKNELAYGKKALEKWNSLIPKRDELEKTIREWPEQQKQSGKHDLINDELAALKKRLKELDHLLDQLEEFSEENLGIMENQLVELLLITYPELQTDYDLLQTSLKKTEAQLKSHQFIYENLKQMEQLLQKTLDVRKRIKKEGILSYIFGNNPNQVISQNLKAIANQIDLILPWFQKNKTLDSEYLEFLLDFHRECKQRWGFKKMDLYFQDTLIKLKKLTDMFDHLNKNYELDYKRQVHERELWIIKPFDLKTSK